MASSEPARHHSTLSGKAAKVAQQWECEGGFATLTVYCLMVVDNEAARNHRTMGLVCVLSPVKPKAISLRHQKG